jgi:putative ABC transport system ATP-binding protein
MIVARNLTQRYPIHAVGVPEDSSPSTPGTGSVAASTLTVLDHVDLEIRDGEVVVILGPSGSGKTTLLGLLAGLDRPSEGEVEIAGVPLSTLDEDQRAALRADQIGFIFQSFHLLPTLTALENVMVPLELLPRDRAPSANEAQARARALLDRVGLGGRVDHYPAQLSGGEQQRVAIARAIAKNPAVLLCDEPTGALDSETGIVVLEALERANRELGTTTALITHNAGIADMADRVVHITNGHIGSIQRNAQRKSAHELSW